MRKPFDKLFGKRGAIGETLVETLVAMLVAGLAMIMLAMAIGVAQHIIKESGEAADAYYAETGSLARHVADEGKTFRVEISSNLESPAQAPVQWEVAYAQVDNGSVVAYWVE